FKPKVDVTCVGSAHAPGGSAPAAQVELRFASLHRRIAVFGDRTWQRGGQSAPAPFKAMPLPWERPPRRPRYAADPLGASRRAGAPEPRGSARARARAGRRAGSRVFRAHPDDVARTFVEAWDVRRVVPEEAVAVLPRRLRLALLPGRAGAATADERPG